MDRPSSVLDRFSGAMGTTVRIVLGLTIFTVSPFLPAIVGLPWWLGFFTFLLGMVVIYAFAGTKEFGVWEWGVRHRVEQRQIADDEIEYCDACGDRAAGGVMRRYAKQVAFLGSPMKTLDWGGNVYCEECSNRIPGGEEVVVPKSVETATADGTPRVVEADGDRRVVEAESDEDTSAIPGTSD